MDTPLTNKTVYVGNISAKASARTVTDFFSFCGKITSITLLQPDGTDGHQAAIIEFQETGAAKTALLLSNAQIVDSCISVTMYKKEEHQSSNVTSVTTEDQIENKDFSASASERTQTSVIASLLAAGYNLGSDAIQKSREFDERNQVSQKLQATAATVVAQASQIDQNYKLSETATSWAQSAGAFLTGLDQQYGISATASALAQQAGSAIHAVGESEVVSATAATLGAAKESVVGLATQVSAETSKIIEETESLKNIRDTIQSGSEAVTQSVKGVAAETKALIDEAHPPAAAPEAPVVSGDAASATAEGNLVLPAEPVQPAAAVPETATPTSTTTTTTTTATQ